jgi:hypothetical protein
MLVQGVNYRGSEQETLARGLQISQNVMNFSVVDHILASKGFCSMEFVSYTLFTLSQTTLWHKMYRQCATKQYSPNFEILETKQATI